MAASVYRIAAELGSHGGMRAILSVLALQKHNRLAFSRPLMAGQSHLARLLAFSPLSFPRKQESSAPKPVTRPWIPACAGMTALWRNHPVPPSSRFLGARYRAAH